MSKLPQNPAVHLYGFVLSYMVKNDFLSNFILSLKSESYVYFRAQNALCEDFKNLVLLLWSTVGLPVSIL